MVPQLSFAMRHMKYVRKSAVVALCQVHELSDLDESAFCGMDHFEPEALDLAVPAFNAIFEEDGADGFMLFFGQGRCDRQLGLRRRR